MTYLRNLELTAADHGGNIEAAKKNYHKRHFLDLSVNINPWGPPLKLWFVLISNLAKIREYPQPGTANGRELLARFFGCSAEQIVLGNGAAELIRHLPQVLPVKRAVVLEPTFAEYGQAFLAVGKPVVKITLDPQFQLPVDQIAAVLQAGDLLFICQPNNPTGGILSATELLRILDLTKIKDSWLAIDESFLWFSGEIRQRSFYPYLKEYPNLVIINSLTKIGAIPGLRLGFVMAGSKWADLMLGSLEQWNVNRLAQKVIPTILNLRFLALTTKRLKKENSWLKERLNMIPGLKIYPWDANFYLVKVEKPKLQAEELIYSLATAGVLVRDCSNFDGLGPEYFRVAVGDHRQNKIFLKKLRRLISL